MIMQGAHCDQLSCCLFIAQCCVLSSISKRFAFASVQCSRSILQGPPIYPTMKSFILEVDGKSFALPEEALRQHEGSMLEAWKDWPTTTSDEQQVFETLQCPKRIKHRRCGTLKCPINVSHRRCESLNGPIKVSHRRCETSKYPVKRVCIVRSFHTRESCSEKNT